MPDDKQQNHNTIFLEDALILSQESYLGKQYLLRILAPKCALLAKPGQFAHIRCNSQQLLRRPISIMRTSIKDGWVDFLYKAIGQGTTFLSSLVAGERLSIMAPIGKGFNIKSTYPLLIGGGSGMPPIIFLADKLRRQSNVKPFVILGSEVPFPFKPRASNYTIKGIPSDIIASMPLLDNWGIISRLTSLKALPGCYKGYVTDLARHWLNSLDRDSRSKRVSVHACGPYPMLKAVVTMAADYGLPVEISLEEYMACAVGSCAGCAVKIYTNSGLKMQRVCVDGPIFDGYRIFNQLS